MQGNEFREMRAKNRNVYGFDKDDSDNDKMSVRIILAHQNHTFLQN